MSLNMFITMSNCQTYRPVRNSALRAVSHRNVEAGSSVVSGILMASFGMPSLSWMFEEPGVRITPGWTEYIAIEGYS